MSHGRRALAVRRERDSLVSPVRPTILLATRNRASTLEAVLNEYCRLETPSAGWDVVIVDNGSTDRTKQVVDSFSDRLRISYCLEPRPGKNAALNTGLALVTGDLTVFTDDDIFPKTDWLVQLCAAADTQKSYTVFGGIIRPRWEVPPSELVWKTIPMDVCFGIHGSDVREGPASAGQVFGGNVAIRTEVFRSGFRFDPAVGPRPTAYVMGGETELIRRLERDGRKVWVCSAAVVEHLIPRVHLTTAWILSRAERSGRAGALRLDVPASPAGAPAPVERTWFGVPRWIFLEVASVCATGARAALVGNRRRLLRSRWRLHVLFGAARQARAGTPPSAA